MDKFIIRSGGSKPLKQPKNLKKAKLKRKETKNTIPSACGCSKIAGMAILSGCRGMIVQTRFIVVSVPAKRGYDISPIFFRCLFGLVNISQGSYTSGKCQGI